MTVVEAIQHSSELLAGRGIESPRLDAEWLLAHALGVPRPHLYLEQGRALTDPEAARLKRLVERRATREPLQHLLELMPFCGVEIQVRRGVLIPRPETELVAEQAWDRLRARTGEEASRRRDWRVLDIGTGSGCLAIAIAHECPEITLHAVDVSPLALACAQDNARRNRVADRIRFWQGDAFQALPPGSTYDLIVSNPPYVPRGEISALAPEVREHDPWEALDGGEDGLDFYRRLAAEAMGFLRTGGELVLELGAGQSQAVRGIFEAQSWLVGPIVTDYQGWPRIFVARRGV